MTFHLYNTLTKQVDLFVPIDKSHVRLYVCGPTVYDRAHIGNLRSAVIFDVLHRLLKQLHNVTFVRNITDIDDKIMQAADRTGQTIAHITQRATAAYHEDMATLGNLSPTVEPRATDHIPEMIAFIETLVQRKHAYEAEGHVLFHINSLPSYGQLSRCSVKDRIAGARVEVAPFKKDPADFVLWKPSLDHQPGWESPWGRGRPGWHIECSAMSLRHLGDTFDIHAGGQDLIFPHHENEIAQSTAAHGVDTFARYWMHNGMLVVDGEKMSKSLGNIIVLPDLLKSYAGETIRFALLTTHYRQTLNFTQELLDQAKKSLDRLYGALLTFKSDHCDNMREFETPLLDDLNTPLALAALHQLAHDIHQATDETQRQILQELLLQQGALLGLLQKSPQVWFQERPNPSSKETILSAADIEEWILKRTRARLEKDFKESDRIRAFLEQRGIKLLDGINGTQWRYADTGSST